MNDTQNTESTPTQPDINPTVLEEVILDRKLRHPDKTTYEIGKDLVELGRFKHPSSVYHVLTESDYLQKEFSQLEKAVKEEWIRTVSPLVLQTVRKALKTNRLNLKDKVPYVQIGAKYTFGVDSGVMINQTININKIQTVVSNMMQD